MDDQEKLVAMLFHRIRNCLTVVMASAGQLELYSKQQLKPDEVCTATYRQTQSVDEVMSLLEVLESHFKDLQLEEKKKSA